MANESDEQRVRKRAYDLWQQDGAPEDRADEYWEKALREILNGGGDTLATAGHPDGHAAAVRHKEVHVQADQGPLSPGDEGPPDAPGVGEDLCTVCDGTGMVNGERCSICGGTGNVLQGIGGG
jgi:hypothetical protein